MALSYATSHSITDVPNFSTLRERVGRKQGINKALVEFYTSTGRRYAHQEDETVYTHCIIKLNMKWGIGVATLGQHDEWNDDIGQAVAFNRAYREFLKNE